MKKFILSICLILTPSIFAQEVVTPKSLFSITDAFVGFGNLTQFVGRIQTDDSGSTNSFEFNPYLTAGASFHLLNSLSFDPELSFDFPSSGDDGYIKTWTYWVQLPMAYRYKEFKFKFGPGFLFNKISAEGGAVTLNNGTSTSDFPLPNGSSTSRNLTVNLGVDWEFIDDFSTRLEGWVINLSDSESRSFNYTLSFYYHFGAQSWGF